MCGIHDADHERCPGQPAEAITENTRPVEQLSPLLHRRGLWRADRIVEKQDVHIQRCNLNPTFANTGANVGPPVPLSTVYLITCYYPKPLFAPATSTSERLGTTAI